MSRLSTAISELRDNERQRQAFDVQGHCAVLAPPGSGKTKLLTTRLAYDLTSGRIPAPQGAACITMTNPAASELRARLRGLGVPPRANLFVGTVHAFALSQVVGPYARVAGLNDLADARLASFAERGEAFDRAFLALFGGEAEQRYERSTMERVRRLADYSGEGVGQIIVDLARRYEQELRDRGLYDFEDLMRYSVEMVQQNEWLRRILVATYPHLYVDEYQDLPPTLDTLMRSLAFDQAVDATLFAAGDPDQAIHGFIGTRPELLYELCELPGVTRVDLNVNYRCGDDIVTASLRALGEERSVRGWRGGGEIKVESPSDGEEAQRRRAVELVEEAIAGGVPLEEITVLTQTNADRGRLSDLLRSSGIPVFARDERDYGTTPLTMAIEGLAMFAAAEPAPAEELAEVLDAWQGAVRGFGEFESVAKLVEVLVEINGESPARDFVDALIPLGLKDLIADPGESEDGRQLERMRVALSSKGRLANLTIGDLGNRARAKGHVMAATTFGVKGLEFDVVVMCDCEEGKLPHFYSKDEAAIAEDRRKFYVSLTRARSRVHLLSSSWRISQKGKRYATEVSRFVEALRGSSA